VAQTKEEQPEVAPVVDTSRGMARPSAFKPFCQQHHARTKEHGEEAAHSAFTKQPAQGHQHYVKVSMPSCEGGLRHADRNVPHSLGAGEVINVHHEDAQKCEAAQAIERREPLAKSNRC